MKLMTLFGHSEVQWEGGKRFTQMAMLGRRWLTLSLFFGVLITAVTSEGQGKKQGPGPCMDKKSSSN